VTIDSLQHLIEEIHRWCVCLQIPHEDWNDLVRDGHQIKENRKHWCNLACRQWRHPTDQCSVLSWCTTGLGTIHETTHLQGDQYFFLPAVKIEASPLYTWSQHHHQPRHRLRFKWLDYCNAVLADPPKSTIALLHRVQNAAARLIAGLICVIKWLLLFNNFTGCLYLIE